MRARVIRAALYTAIALCLALLVGLGSLLIDTYR